MERKMFIERLEEEVRCRNLSLEQALLYFPFIEEVYQLFSRVYGASNKIYDFNVFTKLVTDILLESTNKEVRFD